MLHKGATDGYWSTAGGQNPDGFGGVVQVVIGDRNELLPGDPLQRFGADARLGATPDAAKGVDMVPNTQ
jgi:hypothetical protein